MDNDIGSEKRTEDNCEHTANEYASDERAESKSGSVSGSGNFPNNEPIVEAEVVEESHETLTPTEIEYLEASYVDGGRARSRSGGPDGARAPKARGGYTYSSKSGPGWNYVKVSSSEQETGGPGVGFGLVAIVLGVLCILIGIPMLICPGPGLLLIGVGIALLASGVGAVSIKLRGQKIKGSSKKDDVDTR